MDLFGASHVLASAGPFRAAVHGAVFSFRLGAGAPIGYSSINADRLLRWHLRHSDRSARICVFSVAGLDGVSNRTAEWNQGRFHQILGAYL